MANYASDIKPSTDYRNGETGKIVSAILEQIPELTKVKQIRQRDGSIVDFKPEKIGLKLSGALLKVGLSDQQLLARCTHQALMRIDREFDGHTIPTVDDVSYIVAMVLVDNNLAFAAKKYFEALLPDRDRRPQLLSRGLEFHRHLTRSDIHPYECIEWERRDAIIRNEKGNIVFEQKNVEVPKSWSQTATNIVSSKYFRGEIGQPDREYSVRQMVERVARTITEWGRNDGYFATVEDANTFQDELTSTLVNQHVAFNSPVWFNVGVNPRPQCSACFINSVRDDMRSILNLAVTEGMLFKYGSGTGTNLSALRSSRELLSKSNGKSSGPVSFMKGFDAFAGVIKSGGKTRRAAKMVILNIDHPDIEQFINCKVNEERKAKALIKSGYDNSMDGEAYSSIFFQNANNSVRVNDEFVQAVLDDKNWETKAIITGQTVQILRARDLLRQISAAAWECGDPGLQFDSTINRWNTCPNSGRINASNPCSEFMFLDDTACNLASLNLLKYLRPDGSFDAAAFKHTVNIVVTAMEIIVGNSSYPTPSIEENSFDFRALGIGYANLGALLMACGLAYDSDEGRNLAAAVTALMTAQAYLQSARIAAVLGPFRYYKLNERPFLQVIGSHRDRAYNLSSVGVPENLSREIKQTWDQALEEGMANGFRNAQISLLAPTGTIGFLMDCDTTGIEPDIALVKYKWLVGGGLMKIVNGTVKSALLRLGYDGGQLVDILKFLDENDTIEGAPHLREEHLSVFDCAFRPAKGQRSIHYLGHIRMMAAVQPFLSGAISKTVNLPHEATIEDVENAYIEAWRLGLKAIAIYRDGSKGQQVLTTSLDTKGETDTHELEIEIAKLKEQLSIALSRPHIEYKPLRRRLPDERRSVTHKFSVAGHEGYITVGLYDDGHPGEMFIRMAKGGSVISGLIDAFATTTSIALQYGVPLKVLVNKFVHLRFEPSGFTPNPNIRIAKSIIDYLFRWLAFKYLPLEEQIAVGVNVNTATLADAGREDMDASHDKDTYDEDQDDLNGRVQQLSIVDGKSVASASAMQDNGPNLTLARNELTSNSLTVSFDIQSDAPPCDTCGAIMIRNGACYKCLNCGATSGCS
jgi:ribonucleoside-diphosphate reductase alpha chain